MQTHTHFSPADFPIAFSELVSEAAMKLPPLMRPQDEMFLLRITELVIDLFWQEYISILSKDAQKRFIEATNEETGEALFVWHREYANFAENREAREMGQEVLGNLSQMLPSIMREEYGNFSIDNADV